MSSQGAVSLALPPGRRTAFAGNLASGPCRRAVKSQPRPPTLWSRPPDAAPPLRPPRKHAVQRHAL